MLMIHKDEGVRLLCSKKFCKSGDWFKYSDVLSAYQNGEMITFSRCGHVHEVTEEFLKKVGREALAAIRIERETPGLLFTIMSMPDSDDE